MEWIDTSEGKDDSFRMNGIDAETPTTNSPPAGKICKANASQLVKLGQIASLEARKANRERERIEEEEKAKLKAETRALACDVTFAEKVKARARMQIMSVLDRLEQEDEPTAIDRLASGFSRLCEVERQLDGRPLPGSLRPGNTKPSRNGSAAEPSAPE